MRRLHPLQRAYLLGLRRGFARAQAQMRCKVEQWEDEISVLQADYEALINEIRDERAVQEAVSERAMHPDASLN
jgi:hypothetical protein